MSPLLLETTDDGKWRVKRPLKYKHDHFGIIVVPAGFVTDLDSVPRLPFAYMLTKNASREAAVVHDYLYETGKIGKREISRADADRVFLDAMVDEDVAWWQRRMVWLGVRVGGWRPWRRYRRGQIEKPKHET